MARYCNIPNVPPSVPYPAFEDTFSAFDDSAICPQVEEFNNTIVGTVDCLHLNVYVPTAASSRNVLPVLVWIYGGGLKWIAGRYIYGPKFLVRHDIILVTLNYRLGPYGFMCLDTPAAPGNQGLKDQQLALRWVRDNIEAFGGDADKITIFGESAGSASVDFHLYQEQENLFQQAIMQSGTILNPWVVTNPGNEGPLKLAEHLGVNTDDVSEALSFLATVETKLVIAATIELGLTFRPCLENNFDDVVPFITEHPINLPTTDLLTSEMVPATRDRWNYLNIDSELTMESRPFNDRMAFLDLFYKMNENFQKGINQNDA
ncbi:LOW QUALITY PROTEIN: carboxylic ester hydrolase-like [Choristoneura fumiferana]|uniref:LOW QUALITY PROTEIN: carboxylic ester hydrolase-like n=1 Tax=Choristoneura fumiferana TaxID=7141 RepID=UPI003D15DA83